MNMATTDGSADHGSTTGHAAETDPPTALRSGCSRDAVVFFHPDAFTTGMPKLMGRNVAGASFLQGLLAHGRATETWAVVDHPDHGETFRAVVSASGRAGPVVVLGRGDIGRLSERGSLFYPGPDIDRWARRRRPFGDAAWSLTGITHTTASAGAMDAVTALVTGCVRSWDALVCTSAAVRDNVAQLLGAEIERVRQRFGAGARIELPVLPVIPLGVDTDAFIHTEAEREAARVALGAGADTIVVLYVGRLSFHAKAHPLALYQALERAVTNSAPGRDVMLIECGWFATATIEAAFVEAAARVAPNVRVVHLDGRRPDLRRTSWAAADVFTSLSDNIQETFGITPVEAMAAGLPVVVADWDGYRDTVRHGVDGIRVPTLMPAPGFGSDLALRHALEIDTYDRYCGLTSSLIAVDVEAAAAAFVDLFGSADRRRRMGEAGRRRAREIYDWSALIPRYEALWVDLAERRRAAGVVSPAPWPGRPDPFAAFASYPTRPLTMQTRLAVAMANVTEAEARVAELRCLHMISFAAPILPDDDEVGEVLRALADGPLPAEHAVKGIAPHRRVAVFRSLTWLVKLAVLRVVPDDGPTGDDIAGIAADGEMHR